MFNIQNANNEADLWVAKNGIKFCGEAKNEKWIDCNMLGLSLDYTLNQASVFNWLIFLIIFNEFSVIQRRNTVSSFVIYLNQKDYLIFWANICIIFEFLLRLMKVFPSLFYSGKWIAKVVHELNISAPIKSVKCVQTSLRGIERLQFKTTTNTTWNISLTLQILFLVAVFLTSIYNCF